MTHATAGAAAGENDAGFVQTPAGVRVAVVGDDSNAGRRIAALDDMQGSALSSSSAEDPLLATVRVMAQLHELGKMLVASGFCPKAVNTPEKAMAIMLTGREMGIGPMLAIRAINIIDGKPVIAADLQLARFKASGGRTMFTQLNEQGAVLALRHPNGDEHVEAFTIEMARAAGLLGKDNWRKHLIAMLRSRVITAGLKSIGYEATAGVYDPDEADHWQPGASDAIARGDDPNALSTSTSRAPARAAVTAAASTTTPTASDTTTPASGSADDKWPASRYASTWLAKDGREGRPLDALDDTGGYLFSDAEIDAAGKFAFGKIAKGARFPDELRAFCMDCERELSRRETEKAQRVADAGGE